LAPKGYETIFLGLIPVLIFQSIIVYSEAVNTIITTCFFYGIFCGCIIIFNGFRELIQQIPVLILITIAIRVYSIVFLNELKLRVHTQKIMRELEFAYAKVEVLTLTNERQRMARDLHDTLSQGLAGTIMQLEAVNANLDNNNVNRAREISRNSLEHLRKTLSDSRQIIDDLRLQTAADKDLPAAIESEIAEFKSLSNTHITVNIRVESRIPLNISKHIIYIVRESLNNIAKHAKAISAIVEIIETGNQISINIKDDGIGFNVRQLDYPAGHYGILGMTERVKTINGKIKISSKRKSGTNLIIIIPIKEER
jgi:NarL family two-component system sensor histidine kinase YdfH